MVSNHPDIDYVTIKKARGGDRMAENKVGDLLVSFAFKAIRSNESVVYDGKDHRDIALEIAWNVYEVLIDRKEDIENVKGYVYTSVRNEENRIKNRNKRIVELVGESSAMSAIDPLVLYELNESRILQWRTLLKIKDLLKVSHEIHLKAYIHKIFGKADNGKKLTNKDIAELIGKREGQVKGYVRTARKVIDKNIGRTERKDFEKYVRSYGHHLSKTLYVFILWVITISH